RKNGVTLLLNAAVQAFEGADSITAVATGAGAVPADVVLVGVGVVPNIALARDAGLACDNGIVVDEYGQTSDPDIFAAGDCTNHPAFAGRRCRLQTVQNAIAQAQPAAAALGWSPTPLPGAAVVA